MRSLGALVAMVVCVVASSGCRQHAAQDHNPLPPPPAPARPQSLTAWVISVAGFEHDDLVECDDFEIRVPVKADADLTSYTAKVADAAKTMADEMWKGMSKAKGSRVPTRLQRPCVEQFRDRKAFAVCSEVVSRQDKDKILHGQVLHYSFADVFRSDWVMKECLEQSGTWDALSRDSREFQEAQLRFDTLEAQRQMKKLMPKD